MKRSILFFINIVFAVQLLSGCDYHDINRRLFITEMGIDSVKTDEIIGVSFKTAIPTGGSQGGGEKQQGYATYYEEATSIGQALTKLKAETSLEPSFAHMKVVLVGRKFAENYPVHAIVDYLLRRRDIQNIGYFVIGDPDARHVLSSAAKDSNIPGSEVFMKFGQGTRSPYAQATRLYKFYRSVYTSGDCPFCPIANTEDGNIVINRIGVFGRDFRMKYIMSPEETETFKILINMSESALIDVQTSTHKPYSAEMIGIGTKYKFDTKKDNTITCNINIMGTAMLDETPKPFPRSEDLSGIFSSRLNKEALDLIHKLQDEKLDPMFIQRIYWANTPSYEFTNDWAETLFPKIKFNVNTKIKIQTTGTLR